MEGEKKTGTANGRAPYSHPRVLGAEALEACLLEEERLFRNRIEMEYLDHVYPGITVEEYCDRMRSRENVRDVLYYEALKWHMKKLRTIGLLRSRMDTKSISVAELVRLLGELLSETDEESYQSRLREAERGYGRIAQPSV